MRVGFYVSKENGRIFEVTGELMNCILVRYGQFEISAVSRKDLKSVKCIYLGEL